MADLGAPEGTVWLLHSENGVCYNGREPQKAHQMKLCSLFRNIFNGKKCLNEMFRHLKM